MTNEQDLIRRAVQGDRRAQTELVLRYESRIYNLALRIMRNAEDAEDVMQETFMIMLHKLDTFSGRSSLYTWLYRVATNVALGKLREKQRQAATISVHEPDFETLKGSQLHDWPEHLEEQISDEQFRKCLEKALQELPEKYRLIFVLRDLENLSTRETAEVMQISEANVKVRLMRARLFLRDQLARQVGCAELRP